jgi:hypothetical protein
MTLHGIVRGSKCDLGMLHFEAHSGKKVTYKNQKVTATRTNRLATMIVSLVRDQARFGFCQGTLASHSVERSRIPGYMRCCNQKPQDRPQPGALDEGSRMGAA